jgi:hypothetical protein
MYLIDFLKETSVTQTDYMFYISLTFEAEPNAAYFLSFNEKLGKYYFILFSVIASILHR